MSALRFDAAFTSYVPIQVPPNFRLTLYFQWALVAPGANPTGVALSEGIVIPFVH
ncbi:MAG: hypothetical protein KDB80_06170 [Planctomycetes bacterium]|nr:hypothetical protein [Planctomycetota bacterium]